MTALTASPAPIAVISTNFYDIEVDTGGTSVSAQLGYAKLSGEGLDYSFSLVTMDGDSSVNAPMCQPIDGSDWGWQLDNY